MKSTILPKPVTGTDLAFGGNINELLPPREEIPDEYQYHGNTKWHKLFADMFYCGGKIISMSPKEGIDPQLAMNHIRAIMASWAPKHEHKEAGCAYLFSLWFDDIQFEPGKPEWLKKVEKQLEKP